MKLILLLLTAGFVFAEQSAKLDALGKQAAADFLNRSTKLEDPSVQDFAAGVGARLGASLPGAKFSFTVIENELNGLQSAHEPQAFIGGSIFVPVGLILAAHDESEFAAMLAHSMAHIAMKQTISMPGAAVPLTMMPSFGQPDLLSMSPAVIQTQRQFELDADQFAIKLLVDAGYDPEALLRYLERVLPESKPRSPMPPRDLRLYYLQDAMDGFYPPINPPSGEFASIQQHLKPKAPSLLRDPHF